MWSPAVRGLLLQFSGTAVGIALSTFRQSILPHKSASSSLVFSLYRGDLGILLGLFNSTDFIEDNVGITSKRQLS